MVATTTKDFALFFSLLQFQLKINFFVPKTIAAPDLQDEILWF